MMKNSKSTATLIVPLPKTALVAAENSQFISVTELVMKLQDQGIKISRPGADDYNTLRYYTKIGLLPHMVRRFSVHENSVVGHYPESVVDDLKIITDCKNDGLNNQQIKKLLMMNRGHNPHKKKDKAWDYVFRFGMAGLLLLAVLSMGLIRIGVSPSWSEKTQANFNRINDSFSSNLLGRVSPNLVKYFGIKLQQDQLGPEVVTNIAHDATSNSSVLGLVDLRETSLNYNNESIVASLQEVLVLNEKGDIYFEGNLKAVTLDVKTLKVEEGITIRDKVSGNYYCVYIVGGRIISSQGECEDR